VGSWEDTFTEQLGADIFIEQQQVRTLRFDLSGTLWQDRPTMPEASSALCQGQTSPAVTGNGLSVIYAPDDVVFEAGKYQVKGVPAKALTLEQKHVGVRHLDMPLRAGRGWRALPPAKKN
jgi:hypothetical protein